MRAGAPVNTVCAFSYRGSYTAADVEQPFGASVPGAGPFPFAVVMRDGLHTGYVEGSHHAKS